MTAIDYLHDLEKRGMTIRLRADGRLGVGPVELLTQSVQDGIRQHKQGIIEALHLRQKAENLFGGQMALYLEQANHTDEAPDLPDLLTWWDTNKHGLPMPLILAPAVALVSIEIMDRWVNDCLENGNCRGRVEAQLRCIRKAAEQQ
jgi:hypothetical protein